MPITVEEAVLAPELAQPFSIARSTGQWIQGVWTSTTETVQGYGVISIADSRALEMLPEADRGSEAIVIHSYDPIYVTRVSNQGTQGQSSDIITWQNKQYRVMFVRRYLDYGYFAAICVRMQPE